MSKSLFAEKEEGVRFSFWLEGEEQAEYRLTAFKVEEALFSLTKIEVLLNLSASSLVSADRLGKHASLSIKAEGLAVPTCFSGFIAEATEFFEAGNVITRLVVLPELARLEQEPRYRVFQDLNVPDIVETILCEHGITNALWQLEGVFAPRSFCMQYGESDLAFIHRILAEDAIFYYFLHEDKGRQRPVLCNNIRLLLDCPNRGGLKHDSHGAHGLYDIAGAEEVYCHSLRRSFSAGQALPAAPASAALTREASPLAGISGGAVLSGIAHLPLPLCGHKLSLQCPFDKSLNIMWYLTAVRHEGLSAEGGLLARDPAEYFVESEPGIGAAGADAAAAGSAYGSPFGATGLLPRLYRVNGGPVYEDEAADYSGYGVPYNRFASNVVAMPGGAHNRQAGGKSGDKKAAYACAFTAIAASARYCPPAGRRPVIAGPQAAQLIAVDKKERRYKLALLINAGGQQQAEKVCFWADADSPLGAAAAQAVDPEAIAAVTAPDNRLILEFLGGNPDKPIVLQRSKAAALPDSREREKEADYAGAAADSFAAAGSGADNAAQPVIDADFDNQVKNVLADIAWNPAKAETARPPAAAAERRSDAIPLTHLRAGLQNSAAPGSFRPAAVSLPEGRYAEVALPAEAGAAADKTPALPLKEHQREDIGGIYELNCGEKYLCRTRSLHMNANERLVLRGPGGKIIIDGGSMTLEAPLIRLKGRLMVEESAFDQQEGVKIAIRDELPLVADCHDTGTAMGDIENSSGG